MFHVLMETDMNVNTWYENQSFVQHWYLSVMLQTQMQKPDKTNGCSC